MIYCWLKGCDTMLGRCFWCNLKNPRYIAYHDEEWGKLNLDDGYLYEMLLLECQQAGLSWECVLNKREAYREAFDGFDVRKIASYGEEKIALLSENPSIIRCQRKLRATVKNAGVFLVIQREFTSFSADLLSFFESYPLYEIGKTTSPISDALSRDLKRRGMAYVGSVTTYSYLQAVGLIVSHEKDCFLYQAPKGINYGTL